jgi:transposase
LRRQLNQNSNNSSKPPSSDSIFNKADRPSKTKGGNKKRGGQPGHKGNKLTKFTEVDFIEKHPVSSCQSCQLKKLHFINTRSRQVVDIPMPKIDVTEHLVYNYQFLCCATSVSSPIAKELKQEVQYALR